MIKKMTILGMGNQDKYSYFIVKKEKGFLEWVSKIYSGTGTSVSDDVFLYEVDTPDGIVTRKKRDIMKLIDIHQAYSTEESGRLDVFYGKNKVFLTLYASLDIRKRFIKHLESYTEFLEEKKFLSTHHAAT